MATVMQIAETRSLSSGSGTFTVNWWKTTNTDISIVSTVASGTANPVANWSKPTAVNGPFFPLAGNNTVVNAFAVNGGAAVVTSGSAADGTDGSKNYQDLWPQGGGGPKNPLDYIMDPVSKTGPADVVVLSGNGATFPVTSGMGLSYSMSSVRWAVGGMNLDTGNANYDSESYFNSNWKWRGPMPTSALSKRTAIGYTHYTASGGTYITNFIVAVFGQCRMFDVRKFMKEKGATAIALYLDGSASTQAKNNGTVIVSDTRKIPAIIAM